KMMLEHQSDEEFLQGKIMVLAELMKLRQLCCDPALIYDGYNGNSAKTELCLEMIASAAESGHKILLFSQFTSMLERLTTELKRKGIDYYLLTGAVPKEERQVMVDKFQSDDTPVFCISLKAGGTGLNLTAADIVIHYDPWWNVAVQNQATDRAHRIGQTNVVTVYKLIVQDTIEEKIQKLQEEKRALADELLSGSAVSSPKLSREDLLELLK
ncbi:MAG: SWF/SNF helicase family protein, partial [Butyrivibrio sp.]|nr:SWF/SNF helicase family protein [Butyrivibrio sp.]